MKNPLKVLTDIEFKRFMYSNKKIDTLRDYVTFFTGVETGKTRTKNVKDRED